MNYREQPMNTSNCNSELPISIEIHGPFAPDEFARVSLELATHRSIKHALDWLVGHQPPLSVTDMVTQDEFSHDILVKYLGDLWLVYDST